MSIDHKPICPIQFQYPLHFLGSPNVVSQSKVEMQWWSHSPFCFTTILNRKCSRQICTYMHLIIDLVHTAHSCHGYTKFNEIITHLISKNNFLNGFIIWDTRLVFFACKCFTTNHFNLSWKVPVVNEWFQKTTSSTSYYFHLHFPVLQK